MRFAIFCLLAVLNLPAFGQQIQCPSSMRERPQVTLAEAGWKVVAVESGKQVESLGIYSELDGEYASLVPDHTLPAGQKVSYKWKLIPAEKVSYWLGCEYAGTTARLMQMLPPSFRFCTATYQVSQVTKRQRLSSFECTK